METSCKSWIVVVLCGVAFALGASVMFGFSHRYAVVPPHDSLAAIVVDQWTGEAKFCLPSASAGCILMRDK